MKLADLKNKKIAILGLGINNKQLAAYLSRNNIKADVIENWKALTDVKDKLLNYQVVFRTPGVPYNSELIQTALKNGIDVTSQTNLFFSLCKGKIIAITGTKGKSTTTSLIHCIIKESGKKVWLAGNIGFDPFEFVDQISKDDFVVLELSSFQLQDLKISPHIAVVLNVTLDHVNPKLEMATHYSQQEYMEAKSSIVKHQAKDDFAILHPNLPDWFKNLGESKKIYIDAKVATDYESKLLGKHNQENLAAAISVAHILNIDQSVIKMAVREFSPLEHRLQLVRVKDSISFVDDSISTNEDSTIAAINSFNRPIVLIVGGFDKGHTYQTLAAVIEKSANVKALIVVGQVAPKILNLLKKYKGEVKSGAKDMHQIVEQAVSAAAAGDVILLSPAAASFDMFKDAKDRGQQFSAEVKKL